MNTRRNLHLFLSLKVAYNVSSSPLKNRREVLGGVEVYIHISLNSVLDMSRKSDAPAVPSPILKEGAEKYIRGFDGEEGE